MVHHVETFILALAVNQQSITVLRSILKEPLVDDSVCVVENTYSVIYAVTDLALVTLNLCPFWVRDLAGPTWQAAIKLPLNNCSVFVRIATLTVKHAILHISSVFVLVAKNNFGGALQKVGFEMPLKLKLFRFVEALSMWTTFFESPLAVVPIDKLVYSISL